MTTHQASSTARKRQRIGILVLLVGPATLIAVACSDDETTGPSTTIDGGSLNDVANNKDTNTSTTTDTGTTSDGAVTDAGSDASDADASGDSGPTCTANPCVIQVAAGNLFACALLSNRTVRCWGGNFYGETGKEAFLDGGGFDTRPIGQPIPINNLGPVKQLASGWSHVCALLMDGSVSCWGYNRYGQLAQTTDGGDEGPHATPTTVNGITGNVEEIVSGGFHTCVRLTGGGVMCWGSNLWGQLSSGTTTTDGGMNPPTEQSTPKTASFTGATQIGLGSRFTCALAANQTTLECSGVNFNGMQGRGTEDPFPHPEKGAVIGLAGTVAVLPKTQGYHEHVVLSDGRIQGWGYNNFGEVGAPDAGNSDSGSITTPTVVQNFDNVADVSGGNYFSCALRKDQTVWCWGRNERGVIGMIPDGGSTHIPQQIAIKNVIQVSSGWTDYACALIIDGSVKCWGDNEYSELGRNSDASTLLYDPTPQPVLF